ncbi:MAG: tetratricopeptide repeat protein [Kouleothrix sp.]|nr:tetratricopeptide repeat protein [Kouleothrix sp.]
MTFIDDWRRAIPGSLAEFASLIEVPPDVTLDLLAAAVIWPIGAALRAAQPEAVAALQAMAGEYAETLRVTAAGWSTDRRAAVRALTACAATTPLLRATLLQLVATMLATPEIAVDGRAQLVNLIVRIGDTVSIADVHDSAITVKSTLTDVEQRIGAAPALDPALRDLLRQLIAQVNARPAAIDPTKAWELLASMPTDVVPEPGPLPPGSRQIPIDPNKVFVGRADELRQLATTLKQGHTAAITTGIGGIGKTQLAAEFAHRYGRYFAGGVFWLSFANPAGIPGEIAACGGASAMRLYTDASGLTQDEQVGRVLAEWRKDVPRLIVFDNCDDHASGVTGEELLDHWKRGLTDCRLLVTSRRQEWAPTLSLTLLQLPILPRSESIALLRGLLEQRARADLNDTTFGMIAYELGDLPLALFLAGSFLANNRSYPAAMYLERLHSPELLRHPSLTGRGLKVSATERRDVGRAFALSYDQLNADDTIDATAINALACAARLAPGEPFPRELLLATIQADDTEEMLLHSENALRRLTDLGLLETERAGGLRIHRLISAFTQHTAPAVGAQEAVEDALTDAGNRLVNDRIPSRLLPVVAHLRHALIAADPRADPRGASLANAVARAEESLTNYAAACPLYARALAIREQALGPSHPDTATSLNNLAYLLQAQGDYPAARPLYERALAIREQALGPSHPSTATSLNNLAGLLESQGDYLAARPLYERALAIREQALGPSHPDTAQSLNNLAALFYAQGDYPAARPLYARVVQIFEQALGPSHPDTATSLNNLAHLLQAQGDYPAARPLYERALAIREQALGPSHPDTAQSLNNLAGLLESQGDYPAARPLYERVVQIFEQALGPSHPDTATSLNNLASLLQAQGDYPAARPLYERVVQIFEQALGPSHPSTAQSLNNLAGLLRAQGDYPAARPLYERALAIREQALGPSHPDTATSLNNLAYLLQAQGDYPAARPLYARVVQIFEQALGPSHPDTATSLNNLAGLLDAQGDYPAARPLFERALAIREQALGPSHPDTATSLNNLAYLLQAQGDYPAARPLYERALAVCEQALGPSHPDTATSLNNLAALLESQGDYPAARPLYERALAIREQALGPSHPDTATSLNNLAGLLQHDGNVQEAQMMHERALAIREAALGLDHPDTAQSFWWIGTLLATAGDRDGARARLERAVTIYLRTLGADHPTTQQCQRQLAALAAPPQTREAQIAAITAQAEAEVAAALADPTSDRTALIAQLEARAQWAEKDEEAGSPYLALAAHLRELKNQLISAPDPDTDRRIGLRARADAAVAQALVDPISDRAALSERLAAAADSFASGSPADQELAAHLRGLIAELNGGSDDATTPSAEP